MFGFSFTKETNALFVARSRNGLPVRNVQVVVSYNNGTARSESIIYEHGTVYERNLPAGVQITATASGPEYITQVLTFTIGAGGFYNALFTLDYTESYYRITKKRYL
ncbi:hypothetical protein [Hymenobacter rubripertinctus]|nr:hypothetical protein [Hymenobacter rubripertinctus]